MTRQQWRHRRPSWPVALALCAALTGCRSSAPRAAAGPPGDCPAPAWQWIDTGHFGIRLTSLAVWNNTGLQLPLVSPDGQWAAHLNCPNTLALNADAAFSGRTIGDVTLVLDSTRDAHTPPRIVATGAAWPVWSADSRFLFAVVYDQKPRCGLVVHDVRANTSQRLELGLAHMLNLAVSPGGRYLALVGFADSADESRLYVYDTEQHHLIPLSPPRGVLWQTTPMWVSEQALLYYGRMGDDTGLLGATVGAATPHAWLAKIALPPRAMDTVYSQSGVTRALSADGHWLAVYDAASDQLVLYDLRDSRPWPLGPGTGTGCWVYGAQPPRFLFATDKHLSVVSPGAAAHTLCDGAWLPLWADPRGRYALILAPGQQDWTLRLTRIQILSAP
jgi:hypothetical protein